MIHLGYERLRPASGAATWVAILMAASFIVAIAALGVAVDTARQTPICGVHHGR